MTGVPPALTDLVSASSVMGANAVVKPASFVGCLVHDGNVKGGNPRCRNRLGLGGLGRRLGRGLVQRGSLRRADGIGGRGLLFVRHGGLGLLHRSHAVLSLAAAEVVGHLLLLFSRDRKVDTRSIIANARQTPHRPHMA